MGARHSTPGSADDASSAAQAVPGLVAEPRVQSAQSYARRSNVDGARASEAGPSRSSDGTPTSGAGRGMPKHRARHVGGTSEHRRLALDVLAASGAGRNTASGSLRSTASNDSTPDDSPLSRMLLTSSSFPLHIFAFRGKLIFVWAGVTKHCTVRTGPKYRSIRYKKGSSNRRVQSVNACDASTSNIVSNGASKSW